MLSPFSPSFAFETAAWCLERNVAVVAHSPLAGLEQAKAFAHETVVSIAHTPRDKSRLAMTRDGRIEPSTALLRALRHLSQTALKRLRLLRAIETVRVRVRARVS